MWNILSKILSSSREEYLYWSVWCTNIWRLVSVLPLAVPDQAGGSPEADERPACQSLWAAGFSSTRPGEKQPEAGAGEPHGPAQDPEVRPRPDLSATALSSDVLEHASLYCSLSAV